MAVTDDAQPVPAPQPGPAEWRALLGALPAMVGYWDADLRNRLANDAYVDFFGVTPEEMLGRHISEILGPELFAKNEPYMRAALAGEEQLFDRTIVDPTGKERHTQASYVPHVEDGEVKGFFVLVTDITERVLDERRRKVAEERFRTLFQTAPIGMFLVSREGRVVEANEAGASLFGRTREEMVGADPAAMTHPDDRGMSRALFVRLWRGEIPSYRVEKRYVRRDGRTIWVQLDATVLPETGGAPPLVLGQVQDISERRLHQQELEHLALHDPLTGVLNRRGLMSEVERQVAHCRRYGAAGALLVIDLDDFKLVNDASGHQAGDEVLVAAAEVLRDRVRETDRVGRLGGDEFAVIVPEGDLDDAGRLAGSLVTRVRDRLASLAVRAGPVTASIGIAPFEAGVEPGEMLARADIAMYAAKEAGGDRTATFEPVMRGS